MNKNNFLTKRQMEVLKYTAYGYTIKEIAYILNISHKTVEKHLTNTKLKLNLYRPVMKFLIMQF